MNLDNYELLSRQIPFLGEKRQDRLSQAKVAVVGAGGLGSFVSSMLIRLGVGFVRVIDRDLVEESNRLPPLFPPQSPLPTHPCSPL